MQAELIDIRNHMAQYPPFDEMPEELLDKVVESIEVEYFRAGTPILDLGDPNTWLFYIRSGAVELFRRSGELYNRVGEGDIFGQIGLLMNRKVRFPAKALEDTLTYRIPSETFQYLFENDDNFADFVEIEDHSRLRSALSRREKSNDLMTARVTRLIARKPISAPSTVRLQEAARIMTDQGVSALLLMDEEGDKPLLHGIITDRDLRTRAVTEALPSETPISDIMSEGLITIKSTAFIFEAMLTMLHNNVHHLPVMEKDEVRGVIALSDIVKYESQSSLYLVSNIYHQQNVKGLKKISRDVRDSFVRMVNEDANSHMIGSAMAGIGRSFTQRLLELGEEKLGPPPVPYCFLGLGSMARDEQLVVTDQDNAMILDDSFVPEEHDAYFLALAKFVSDGLAECGYKYCTGDIMATNPKWRQPLKVWKEYFTDWIENPKAEALLNSNIFFDLDGIHGNIRFADELKALVAERASNSQRFLTLLARNALNRTPPLGFFRTFVLEEDGQHRKTFNLKRRGTAPLSDLIRVHALACGSRAQNSFDRLSAIAKTKLIIEEDLENLQDALEFISIVRIRHQALAIEEGREPDNNVRPEDLSPFERNHLKDAFQIVSNAQKFLRFRYNAGVGRNVQ
ncbi:MAG: cyclic nucleotide-binding/CBS domain-containing protein [Gammaproteobacteria bacterium]|uniref:Signal-transduction protein n=1 Tax=Marinobacter nitratireducens TaxID=1137280 RepID=A0A072MXN0_9GAMM|nr:putative nucleotidyltransferase substrate binding domain-containing protein [Marinobacter nitratireducens]KEF30026.1 Putative signal-transduction protein [Marinobacter nitratireducens]TNE76324.1 MAG: cyclic nucleotide-binding/CBS domain-containing protein [Gammaproteobacteria bacterium]TNF00419.1 MAG: cyclic nucleotide-binding/CBS domain-containing protein [Gammaproteobacteria bacterium]